MSRPDKEIARLRRWSYVIAPFNVKSDVNTVLDYISELEEQRDELEAANLTFGDRVAQMKARNAAGLPVVEVGVADGLARLEARIVKLEAELAGHRRQDSGYMKRSIEAQGG